MSTSTRRTSEGTDPLPAILALSSALGSTKEFAGDPSRRRNFIPQVAQVHSVLDQRVGVPVALEDDALGLIVVEVHVVLERACVLGPHQISMHWAARRSNLLRLATRET